jgi:hypothetical protein
MTNEIVKQENQMDIVADLQNTEKVVRALMASKHYDKLGASGIYAILQKAKSMGINQMDAINGGCYYVQGKVEMSSQMMNRLIRSKGHSIQKDEKSSKTCCILHGKRSDNGDKWTVEFDLEDAKKAGIYKSGGPWEKYPGVMCFNRALSMLARQLFPDIIVDCYVQGEISESPGLFEPIAITSSMISQEEAKNVSDLVEGDKEPEKLRSMILSTTGADSYESIPADRLQKMLKYIEERQERQRNEIVVKPEPIEEPKTESVDVEDAQDLFK